MTPIEKYEQYLLNNNVGERIVEVIELSHSDFDSPFYLCREPSGVQVKLEDNTVIYADGVNMDIRRNTSGEDLDEKYSFDFSDVNNVIQDEADKIPIDSTEKVKVIYRLYMASTLMEDPAIIVRLEGKSLAYKIGSVTIEAESPTLVANRCGKLYTMERFPPLLAFYD